MTQTPDPSTERLPVELPAPPYERGGRTSSPSHRLLPDNRTFELTSPAWYVWMHTLGQFGALGLVVPEGMRHDLASVPRPLWMLISPFDLGLASLFHDYLYRHGGRVVTWGWNGEAWESIHTPWTREQADRLFARIMREQNVKRWRRRWAYRAVHWLGGGAWRG
jgi:hypothetical protein